MRGLIPRLSIFKVFGRRVVPSPILPVANLRLTPRGAPTTHLRPLSQTPRLGSTDTPPPLPENTPISQRLKHLIKSYGWYALGVYLFISVFDFGVAFVGINLLGADYVSQWAATVKSTVASVLHSRPVEPGRDEMDTVSSGPAQGSEGLYAMIVLAYTIHKTLFLPLRIGLTAAFTPRLVGWLTKRGWAGSAGTRRAAVEMREKLQERRRRSEDN